jgi:L-cysteine/cystine lyase
VTTPEEARGLFPVLERLAYLNAGTFGPLARPVVEALQAEQELELVAGRCGSEWFERALELRQDLREALAQLVGVQPENVALTASTTDGCNIVAAGLGLGSGDEVVTTNAEHFGLLGALHASGARVVVTDPDPAALLAAVTARTRLIAVSEVLWTTGRRLPVRELRAQTGVPVLVDGAQSVGAVPVAADGLDFLTISGQKWLCGPDATGALVVADPEQLEVARPSFLSQDSHEPDGSFVPRAGAARFEPNWMPVGAVRGLQAALSLAPAWRFEHAARMTARCRERLAAVVRVEPGDATLVAFRPEGSPEEVVAALEQAGVVVRQLPGRGLVRVSVGWWTNDDDLERLLEALPR